MYQSRMPRLATEKLGCGRQRGWRGSGSPFRQIFSRIGCRLQPRNHESLSNYISQARSSAFRYRVVSQRRHPILHNPDKSKSPQADLRATDRMIFWLLVGAIHGLSILPDFILYPLGVAGGWLGYHLDRRHIGIGMRNLEIAFPERSESERRRILRESYMNLGRARAEYIRLAGVLHSRLQIRLR